MVFSEDSWCMDFFFLINESCEVASLESRRRCKDLEMAPLDLLMYVKESGLLALLVFLHS